MQKWTSWVPVFPGNIIGTLSVASNRNIAYLPFSITMSLILRKPQNQTAKSLASLGYALASVAAPKKKKKKSKTTTEVVLLNSPNTISKKRRKKNKNSTSQLSLGGKTMVTSRGMASMAFNASTANAHGHKPYSLHVNSSQLGMGLPANSGRCYFVSGNDVQLAAVNLNPSLGTAAPGAYNCPSFPSVVSNIAKNFSRYKITNCTIKWVPYTPATVYGAVAIGFIPDGSLSANTFQYADILSLPTYMAGSMWQPMSFQVPKEHLDNWLYTGSSSGEAENKFNNFGGLVCGQQGAIYTATAQILGSIVIECDLTLDGLGLNTLFSSPFHVDVKQQESSSSAVEIDADYENLRIVRPLTRM